MSTTDTGGAMSGTEGTPARRRRAPRPAPLPRVGDLDALLRDVDALRLHLETDLTLAASAVEAGEPALAADILGADREVLKDFEALALGRLDKLAAESTEEPAAVRRRTWVPAHAASFVAAAAVVGLLAGVVPQVISHRSEDPTPVAASNSLERLQELVLHGNPSQIRAASDALHAQLASMIAVARTDPAAAQNALLLLSYEQNVIGRSADRTVLADVLQQSEALASAIRAALPPSIRASVPAAPQVPQQDASPTPQPSRTAKATPSPTTRPTTESTASPAPQHTSSPSPAPTNPYPLPSPPVAP